MSPEDDAVELDMTGGRLLLQNVVARHPNGNFDLGVQRSASGWTLVFAHLRDLR
jgi:hypothetical protein